MPSRRRIWLRAPSAAIRYFARTVEMSPLSRLRNRAVTPSASSTAEMTSVAKRKLAPSSSARWLKSGSSASCDRNMRSQGLTSLMPEFRSAMNSRFAPPTSVSTATTPPF